MRARTTLGTTSRTAAVVAAAAVVALVLPASATEPAPHLTDVAGDANAVNAQGFATGGAADGTGSSPVSYAPADLLSVTYSTTFETVPVGEDGVRHVATGVQARIKTSAPAKSDGPTLIYRLNGDVGGCGGFLQAYVNGPTSAPTDGKVLEFRQFASRGCAADATVRNPAWTHKVVDGVLVFSFPYEGMAPAERTAFGLGKSISTTAAEVRTQLGTATAPAIDIMGEGKAFKIGSDLPKDVPCTVGCP